MAGSIEIPLRDTDEVNICSLLIILLIYEYRSEILIIIKICELQKDEFFSTIGKICKPNLNEESAFSDLKK